MREINLCGRWYGECHRPSDKEFEFAGNVPGSAVCDLINAGKLPQDIFWRDNAEAVTEYEKCDYVYRREFSFSGGTDRATLHFERIDTYADVFLNGDKIYHSENGNIAHDIDVSGALREGSNELEVRLYSPVNRVADMPKREGAFTTERLYTRRMQCTYGWDWVARFLTVGLGDCRLRILDEFEISPENVYIATMDADRESATVRVDIAFPFEYSGRILELIILDPDGHAVSRHQRYCQETLLRHDFDVPAPELWYPLGYGEQPLYTFAVYCGGELLYSERFGIRTVKIMQLPDREGSKNHTLCLSIKNKKYDLNTEFSGFVLKINGEKVFCRGANWVPCVPYTDGCVDARQTEILELCAEAGVNMLRIWGGGAFESRHFYSECSRLGIMVTQDFLMACGAYPEDDDRFIEELNREALYAVRLCRNQPCIMWWSGDNENAVNGCDTDEDYRGRRSAYEGIAPILYREDPYRRFLPSSPYGGDLYASNTVGTTHNTQFLGQMFPFLLGEDLSGYKDEFKKYRARFIAEEPQLGAVSLPSLRRFMSEEDIFDGESMWYYHTKDNPALSFRLFDCLSNVAKKVLGDFSDSRDRLFKLQYIQYEWIRVLMEQARREGDLCSGIIFWMMNDCWPAASGWALIDYYNLPKNAFYSFKRCARAQLASIDHEDGIYRVYVVNDADGCEAELTLRAVSDRSVRELVCNKIALTGHSVTVAYESEIELADGETLVCDVIGDGVRDRAFYRHGALEMRPATVRMDVDREARCITVTACDEYLHAVCISGEVILEDNCFSLLPGESKTVCYRPVAGGADTDISVEAYTLIQPHGRHQ